MAQFQLALATDMSYLQPTLVAMMSAVEHTPGPVLVHVLGDRLSDGAVDLLESACRNYPGATLAYRDIADCVKSLPHVAVSHWTRVNYAPLLLPRYADGSVLWLDSDILVRGSLAPLLNIDMGTDLIAAAREYTIFAQLRKDHEWTRRSCSYQQQVTSPFPPTDQFSSGVMVMDCRKIKEHPEFENEIVGYSHFGRFAEFEHDQVILNLSFKGRVTFIDPEWNCVWGRIHYARWLQKKALPTKLVLSRKKPVIIHYTGSRKPWASRASGVLPPLRSPWWIKYGIQVIRYRREASRLLERLSPAESLLHA